MFAPALDDPAPSKRWHHSEDLGSNYTYSADALIAAAGDDEDLFRPRDLSGFQPHFRARSRFRSRRKQLPEVQCSLGAECSFVECVPECLELWFTAAHQLPRMLSENALQHSESTLEVISLHY